MSQRLPGDQSDHFSHTPRPDPATAKAQLRTFQLSFLSEEGRGIHVSTPLNDYTARQHIRLQDHFKLGPKKAFLNGMGADMQIADRGWDVDQTRRW